MLARIRKALGAAGGGFVGGAVVYLKTAGHVDGDTIAGAAGAGVTAAIVAFLAAYFTKANAPAK
jgi:hypothetical protein